MNWGWKVTVVLVSFIGFILFFLIQALSFDGDLVDDEYYKLELEFQHTIEAKNNFKNLEKDIEKEELDDYLVYTLPQNQSGKKLIGSAHLYRASNADLDRKYEIKDGKIYIPKSDIQAGAYTLKFSWKQGEQVFFTEKAVHF